MGFMIGFIIVVVFLMCLIWLIGTMLGGFVIIGSILSSLFKGTKKEVVIIEQERVRSVTSKPQTVEAEQRVTAIGATQEPAAPIHHCKSELILTICRGEKESIINDPDEATIEQSLSSLSAENGDFFILENSEHNFVQGFYESFFEDYTMEYHENGNPTNLSIKNKALPVVLEIVLNFANGRDFKNGHEWQAVS